jgi:hypothetical protein
MQKRVQTQLMADLPPQRIQPYTPPFLYTDFFFKGLYWVINNYIYNNYTNK